MGLQQQRFWSHTDLAKIIQPVYPLEMYSKEVFSAYGFVEKMSSFQQISEHGIFHGITTYTNN